MKGLPRTVQGRLDVLVWAPGVLAALAAGTAAGLGWGPVGSGFAGLVGAVVGVGLVQVWLRRRVSKPFRRLAAQTEDLAVGRGDGRVEVPEPAELARLARSVNELASRLVDEIHQREAERRQLDQVLANMSEGILVVDVQGRPTYVNAALRSIFSVPADTPTERVLEVIRQPRLTEMLDTALENATSEGELQVRDRTVAAWAAPLGGFDGALLVCRDATEELRLTRMRRDFVANVSHELKTPLAVIQAAAETLAENASGVAERFVTRILEQCERLSELLEDLLTLSRLESPETELQRESISPSALARRALDLVSGWARDRGVTVVADLGDIAPMELDPVAIERLIVNLLDNALKYGRGAEVRLSVDERDGGVEIRVADDGPGIPSRELSRIFERFYRVDSGRSREGGGSGLGLAIVKHVAESHGGSVEVDSTPGEGTEFRVWLPRP